ncbi:MAG: hypothetical protein Q4B68_08890, partial [Bacteroidales bacterium]|nr:hypothetical protein [Bacteroidales bacterium]
LFIGLTEDLTDIPYGFCDSYYDIYMSTSTSKATIYFYDKAWDKLGVQSIYRGGGEERRSNVVWVKKAPTAITDVDARTAKSISYFNISGQRIAQPTQGICIKRTQWTDGTVTTEKIAK